MPTVMQRCLQRAPSFSSIRKVQVPCSHPSLASKHISFKQLVSSISRSIHCIVNAQHNPDDVSFVKSSTELCAVDEFTNPNVYRLTTPANALYRYSQEDMNAHPHLKVFPPFWAFLWPGGYGLTRYICDNPDAFHDCSIFDLGSGCGSSSVAALLSAQARLVIMNDIDPLAVLSGEINMKDNINKLSANQSTKNSVLNRVFSCTEDYLVTKDATAVSEVVKHCEEKVSSRSLEFSSSCAKRRSSITSRVSVNNRYSSSSVDHCRRILLVGDMLYDGDIGPWVLNLVTAVVSQGWEVYVGDPGRAYAVQHLPLIMMNSTTLVATYELPAELKRQNCGLSEVSVRRIVA